MVRERILRQVTESDWSQILVQHGNMIICICILILVFVEGISIPMQKTYSRELFEVGFAVDNVARY